MSNPKIKALDALKREFVGFDKDGKAVYTKRSLRLFLIALLAGGRTVVLNATIVGRVEVNRSARGALIAGCEFKNHE